jgi:hypothetical protein
MELARNTFKVKKSNGISEGKPFRYPMSRYYKRFQIKYPNKLSSKVKFILSSFQNKYMYYAIEDIFDCFSSPSNEQSTLLAMLYTVMLDLHNNLYINFFDIWIDKIYIIESYKENSFSNTDNVTFQPLSRITFTVFYRQNTPTQKLETYW